MLKRIVAIFLVLLSLITVCVKAESLLSEEEIIKGDSNICRFVRENIKAEPYTDDLELDRGISSVAISPNGEVAIIGKATKGNCDFIISVYSPEGEYKYGHKMNLRYHKGHLELFYSEKGDLCYRCCYTDYLDEKGWYPEVIIVLNAEGICDCYEILSPNTFKIDNLSKIGTTQVYVSPQSDYRIERVNIASLNIQNIVSHEVTEIYRRANEHK